MKGNYDKGYMPNGSLFDTPKDRLIARLRLAIEKFKEYDESRKAYYRDKMAELAALRSEIQAMKSDKSLMNDLHALSRLKADAAKWTAYAESSEHPEDFALPPDFEQLMRRLQSMRTQIKNLNEKNRKLRIDNDKLIYRLAEAQKRIEGHEKERTDN